MRQKSQHFLLATVLRKFTLNTKFKGDDMFVKRFKFMSFAMIFAISLILIGCDGLMTEQSDSKASEDTSKTASAQSTSVITGKIFLDESPVMTSEGRSAKMSSAAVNKYTHTVTAVNLTDDTVYTANTSSTGEYILTGLTAGKYQLTAENTNFAKAYSKTLSVGRGTQATVNVTLQALGTVVGYAPGADAVSIWGTNINALAFSSNSGRFELHGVPMGTMWLKIHIRDKYVDGWDYAYRIINITQSGTTELTTWNFKDLQVSDVWDESRTTLGFLIFGLGVELTQRVTREALAAHVELLDVNNDPIPFTVGQDGETDAKDLPDSSTYWTIQPEFGDTAAIPNVADYGTVTVTIKSGLKALNGNDLDTDLTRTINFEKRVLAIEGGWGDNQNITYFFPDPLDPTMDLSGVTVKDTSGNTLLPNLHTAIPAESGGYLLHMQGDFRPGREYQVDLGSIDDNFATTTDGYVRLSFYDYHDWDESWFAADDTNVHLFQTESSYVANMAPENGAQAVRTNRDITVLFGGGTALNTGSLVVTVTPAGGSVTTYNSNQFAYYGMTLDDNDHCDWNDFLQMEICRQQVRGITIKDYQFLYDKEYTVVVSGEDAYGKVISQTSVFKTLTPAITSFEPESSMVSQLAWAQWDGLYQVRFNTPMDMSVGTMSVKDLSTDADIPVVCGFGYYDDWSASFRNDRPDRYNCNPSELLPQGHYEITLSGFTAAGAATSFLDVDAVYQYKAPPKSIYYASVANGEILDPQFVNHQVSFNFFGVLTPTEKTEIEAKLKVTSVGLDMSTDANHPLAKIFFFDDEWGWGTKMIVAFTMDENRSYEIGLYDTSGNYSHLTGIMSPTSLLSFVVAKSLQRTVAEFDLIDWFGVDGREWVQGEGYLSRYINGRLRIPLFYEIGRSPDGCYEGNLSKYFLSKADIEPTLSLLDASGDPLTNGLMVHYVDNRYYTDWNWNNETQQDEVWCVQEVNFNGAVEVNYDSNYTVVMDAIDLVEVGKPVKNTIISSPFNTNPIGTFRLRVNSYDQKAPLELILESNTLLKISDIKDTFTLGAGVNIVSIEPIFIFNPTDTTDDTEKFASDFSIVVDRPIYAVFEYSIGTDGNVGVNSWDINSDAPGSFFFTSPQPGYLEVIPDLMPMALIANSTPTPEDFNGAVAVEFSRLADPSDFEDASGDVTVTSLPILLVDATGDPVPLTSVEAFYGEVQIMENEWSSTPISVINGIEGVIITPASPLDVGSTYQVILDSGREVKSLGGVQELPVGYSENVGLTYGAYLGSTLMYRHTTAMYMGGIVTGDSTNHNPDTSEEWIAAEFFAASGFFFDMSSDPISLVDNSGCEAGPAVWNPNADPDQGIAVQRLNCQQSSYDNIDVSTTVSNVDHSIEVPVGGFESSLSTVNVPFIGSIYSGASDNIEIYFGNSIQEATADFNNFMIFDASGNELPGAVTDISLLTGGFGVTFDVTPDSPYGLGIQGFSTSEMDGNRDWSSFPNDMLMFYMSPSSVSSIAFDFEDGNIPASFVMSGDSTTDWMIDSSGGANGTGFSLTVGNIGDSQTSCVAFTTEASTDYISFYDQISTEDGADFISLYVDGNTTALHTNSGELGWTPREYNSTYLSNQIHEFKWCYEKDGSISSNLDSIWIDEINLVAPVQ